MPTLYELNEQFARLMEIGDGNAVDTETGEVWTTKMIDALQLDRETKIENCLLYAKNQFAYADMLKAEIDKLESRRTIALNKAERAKNYAADNLKGENFKTARVAVSWRKSEVVEIDAGATLPPGYYLPLKAASFDKTKIKAALKAGKTFDGVRLVEKNNIQVK